MSKVSRNKTIEICKDEFAQLDNQIIQEKQIVLPKDSPINLDQFIDSQIHGDALKLLPFFPDKYFNLIFIDPPYNMYKEFNKSTWHKTNDSEYEKWLELWMAHVMRTLKDDGSIYICSDWKSGPIVYHCLSKYAIIHNRITFEREKGRGAKNNWKNNSEDIYFASKSKDYYFDVDSVKLRKKVIAPYRVNGKPKDWQETKKGNFRLTHPSNIWTDITIPFWSMAENTEHPTQKPEKLLAKIILASSKPNDIVFDPFSGSGTTGIVAKKLNRRFIMIEREKNYCRLSQKRLLKANENKRIQGFQDGVFNERNT